MVRLAFLSAGASRHGLNIQKQVQAISDEVGWGWETTFWEWVPNRGYDDYDFASVQWCWWEGLFERAFEFMLHYDEPKHLGRFIGTDLLQQRDLLARGYPNLFHAAKVLVADAPNLVQEAHELTGLDVGYVRSIPPTSYDPVPIERWDAVLGYVPTGRDDFFRWTWFLELARDYPHLAFHIIGREEGEKDLPENVVVHKEVQGEEKFRLFQSCLAYLRPVEHDGVGLTLIEMAQFGRHIFHSDTRIPYVLPARSVGEVEFGLDTLLAKPENPSPTISDYYRAEYSIAALTNDLRTLKERMEKT